MGNNTNWERIYALPNFTELHKRKSQFLWSLIAISVVYCFLLPTGAGYFPAGFAIKIWGPLNVGLLFALSQFLVAWGIAFIYARRADGEFDALAESLKREFQEVQS